jgi:hypothetical protein
MTDEYTSLEKQLKSLASATEKISPDLVSAFLSMELEKRRTKNERYSIRAFARDIGQDPADLSKVLRGVKFLSPRAMVRVVKRLGVSDEVGRILYLASSMRDFPH